MIGGLILAGGRSSRFGREKALADLAGAPLITRVRDVLTRGASPVAVSAAPGSAAAAYAVGHGLACLHDDPADPPGPLAGLRAGLRWARAQGLRWLATCPCDTPFLPSDLVARLAAARSREESLGERGSFASTPAGVEPLCALWPVAALERVEAAPGHPSIRRVLADLGALEVRFDDHRAFANLNTPQDYAEALARRGYPPSERPGETAPSDDV